MKVALDSVWVTLTLLWGMFGVTLGKWGVAWGHFGVTLVSYPYKGPHIFDLKAIPSQRNVPPSLEASKPWSASAGFAKR